MTLEELKQFIAVDFDDDDSLIAFLQETAEEYVQNAVGERLPKDSKLYKHALAILVGHWYDNREAYKTGTNSYTVPDSFQSIIHQLRTCYP